METDKLAGLVVVLLVAAGIGYFFISSETAPPGEIPDYLGDKERSVYEWAKTEIGNELLEQVPCYCGCKYEGHIHTRHCFWKDDGSFDKHGITCSVCFDIALKTRAMHEDGKDICEIRKEIDTFYEANKHLGTETPMPEGCE
ncbi:MAG: hypothetical protein GOV15_02100 [Candidatus Diapherotrites archaeon]|nr:hypothetical protein [Candidatus Diapherotrites archaeon]